MDVCIPLHHPDPTYLADLSASLRQQSFGDFNVLVSDDSESPSDSSVLDRCFEGLTVRFHREAPGQGMAHNWNTAISLGSSQAVLLLGQDDLLSPTALSSLHAALDADESLVACGSGATYVGSAGEELDPRLQVNDRSFVYRAADHYRLDRQELTYLCLRNGNALGEPSAVLFRRSAYDAVDGFDTSYVHTADVDFYLRLVALGDVAYLSETLVHRRLHGGSTTNANVRSGATSRERLRLFEQHASGAGLSAEQFDRCVASLLLHCSFDLTRAAAKGWRQAAKVNANQLGRCLALRPRPRYVVGAVTEALTKRNQDQR